MTTVQPGQSSAGTPVVSLRRVRKEYGSGSTRVVALDDVDLDLQRGEFAAIMGASGSGKSTLMNVAAGLDDVSSGEVVLDGAPLHLMDDTARTVLRRDRVGFVFHAFNLVPALDVVENIELPFDLAARRIDTDQQQWIDHLIGSLGLSQRRRHRPAELSGGQQQRVAIARALAPRPAVVFADEPTGHLDARSSREVLSLLRAACSDYGQTIAMVTHDPVAAAAAARVVVIADGAVASDHPALTPQQISALLIDQAVLA